MDPREGDIAEDGNGNFLVYRGGIWYPSNEQGFPLERIPRSDYGERFYQQPNGDIVREGPRGGFEVVERAGEQQGPSTLVGADARGRYQIGADVLADAARNAAVEEARGGNPMNRDWGAVLLNSIDIDPRADSSLRPFAPLARFIGGQDFQNYDQALATYESTILPIQSGATITDSEARRQIRADFPQLGDSEETVRRKAANRLRRINAVFLGLGREPPFSEEQIADPTSIAFGDELAAIQEVQPQQAVPQVIDLQTASRDEIIAALRAGGTFRDGPDGEPYSLPPQEPQFGTPPEGARQAQPGVFVRGVADAARDVGNNIGAFAQSFTEWIPFADEAASGIVGLTSGRGYEAARATQSRLAQEDREERPLARNLGGITGAVAPLALPGMGGASFVARAPNLGYTMTRGAAVGGGYGALYGAAGAEGGLGERTQGAGGGLMTGALFGGVAPPVARGVGAIAAPVIRPMTEGMSDLTQRLMGRPMTAQDRAVRTLTRGATLGDLENQVRRMRDFGADPTFADVAGSNVQSRVRVAATRQTPGRQVAEDFAAGRRSEMQDYTAGLAQRISPREATPQQLDEALEQYQRQASGPAFSAVRNDRIRLDDSSVMALRGQEGRNAIRQAASAFGSSVNEDERLIAAELNRLADDVIDQPNVEITVGAADLISRYLNRAGGTDANLQRIFSGAGRAVRDNARQQSPGYDEALKGFAARAQLGEAVEVGERFVGNRGYTGDFVSGVRAMDDPQREITAAAARAAVERAAGTGRGAPGVLDAFATGRDQIRRTEALLGPERAAQIREGAQIGRQMIATAQNVNPRFSSQSFLNFSDNAEEIGGAAGNLLRGRPVSAAIDFIRSRGLSDEQAQAIVEIALDPRRTDEVINILRTRFPDQEARRIVEQLTPLLGAQAGSAQAPRQPRMVGPDQ